MKGSPMKPRRLLATLTLLFRCLSLAQVAPVTREEPAITAIRHVVSSQAYLTDIAKRQAGFYLSGLSYRQDPRGVDDLVLGSVGATFVKGGDTCVVSATVAQTHRTRIEGELTTSCVALAGTGAAAKG